MVKHTRLFNSANIDQFKVHLEDVCWNLACASSDPNTIFHACFNKCFPQVTIKTKEKWLNKPYITQDIRSLIKEKNKLQKKFA